MNKSSATIMAAALMLASSCTEVKQEGQGYEPIIGKQEITIKDGRLTPEALWAMGRIGSLSISPDGKKIAYTVAYYSVPENKSHHVIYVMNTDGKNNTLLTQTAWNESEPQWIKGGTKIAFLCNESGGSQIWEMNPDGTERRIISDFKGDIEGFSFSPDGKKILFISQIKYGQRTVDLYPDLPKASGIIVNDLMYKHWDEWVESIPHPFIADFNGNMMGAATDIMEGEPFEAPMKPFGGIEQLAWSNDSKQIAYTSRKKQGLAYAVSTDSDIYLYNIEKGTTLNLCKLNGQDSNGTDEMRGYDTNPKFSPDGKYIAWQSMERDGYESDRNRLCVYNLNNGQKTFVTESFESGVDDYCWNNDSQSLYFIGVWHGTSMVYSTNLNGDIKKLTDGMYDYGSVAMAGDKIITKRHSISAADEIYTLTPADGQVAQLSHENDHIFKQLKLGKVEERWTKTTDGKQMLSWVIYPTNFDANKKYPTLLFCEGGPQSPVSQFWSYRWNFQIMAANDYII
ncbi:peptidase S9, partial [Phocaeicola dorei]